MSKEKILKAAFELFTAGSYEKVSMNDIAARAGLSKGGVFHHFSSKYQLGVQCLVWNMDSMMAGLTGIMGMKDPAKKIKGFIDTSVDLVFDNPKLMRFFLDIFEESSRKGMDTDMWMEWFHGYIDTVAGILTECKVPEPEAKAMLLMATLDALGMEMAMFSDLAGHIDRALVKSQIFEMFVGNYIEDAN